MSLTTPCKRISVIRVGARRIARDLVFVPHNLWWQQALNGPYRGWVERLPPWEGKTRSGRTDRAVLASNRGRTEFSCPTGCFSGTLAEFAAAANAHEDEEHRRRYAQVVQAIEMIAEAVAG